MRNIEIIRTKHFLTRKFKNVTIFYVKSKIISIEKESNKLV